MIKYFKFVKSFIPMRPIVLGNVHLNKCNSLLSKNNRLQEKSYIEDFVWTVALQEKSLVQNF